MMEATFVRVQACGTELVPLTPLELAELVRAPQQAERTLMCTLPRDLEALLALAQSRLPAAQEDRFRMYPWRSVWLVLRRYDRAALAACFFDGPPADGAARVSCLTLHRDFESVRGAAMEAIMRWAAEQPGVRTVTAS